MARSIVAGILVGLVFFGALVLAVIAGLREPYVSILIFGAAAFVFVISYIGALRRQKGRDR